MSSEWMNVMLEEIARKKAEAEQVRIEEQRRREERRPDVERRPEAEPRRNDTAQG
jgi:hypothetical protein